MRPYCLMTLCGHGRVLSGEWTMTQMLTGIRGVGIEAVEPATTLFRGRPDLERDFAQQVADAGLTMPCYDALANLVEPDVVVRRKTNDLLREDIERCHKWGIPRAMIAGSRSHPNLSGTEARKLVADGMNACLGFARDAGVELLLEAFGADLGVHASSAQLKEVVDQCQPEIMTTFDMGNFVLGGDRPLDVLETWAPRIKHVHVKDFVRLPADSKAGLPSLDGHRYDSCRLGAGAVEAAAVLKRLKALGYSQALSLETGGADWFAEVAADLAVVKAAVEG